MTVEAEGLKPGGPWWLFMSLIACEHLVLTIPYLFLSFLLFYELLIALLFV